jgi:integrase
MASVFKRGRWVDAQGRKCRKDTPGAIWQESRYYTVQVFIDGKPKLVKGYTDKQASEQLASKLERAKAQGAEGLDDPFKPHRKRPLIDHLKEYVAELRTLGRDDKYVYNVEKRLTKLFVLCAWKTLGDVSADTFCHWREMPIKQRSADSENGTIGPRTLNQYLEAARAFCRWCVKRARMASNPLTVVERIEESGDVRRQRRALTAEQAEALLVAVPQHYKPVYRFLLATGLRRQEVADLVWGDVRLASPTPFLKLRAKATKSRRADTLPLRAEMAVELTRLRGDAGDGDRVFAAIPTMDEHREYLIAAGIPYEDEDGRRADLHALRHTYGTMLSNVGVSPREAMELMRHTDLRLTMKVYTDPRIFDLASAVEKLKIPAATQASSSAATGTDSKTVFTNESGRCESVSSPSAEIGVCATTIGGVDGRTGSALTLATGGDRQQKTPSGGEGVQTRQVGLEPTTSRLTAGCSTIELLPNCKFNGTNALNLIR